MKASLLTIALFLSGQFLYGQTVSLTLEQAVEMALKNNEALKAAGFEAEAESQLKKTSFDLPKTNVSLLYGQYNSYRQDNNFTITQAIPFTAFGSQASLAKSLAAAANLRKTVTGHELSYRVKQVYFQLMTARARHALLLRTDSIYEGFLKSASDRYRTGEARQLEQITAQTQRNDTKNQVAQNEAQQTILRTELKTLLNVSFLPEPSESILPQLSLDSPPDTAAMTSNPSLSFMRQQVEVARSRRKLENAKFAPDLLVGYFNQTLIDVISDENGNLATASDRFSGFQVGLGIPLWFLPHQGRAKAARYNQQSAQSNFNNFYKTMQGQMQQATLQLEKNQRSLDYYRNSALPNAELILRQAQAGFRHGEIGYAEYLFAVRSAIGTQEGYLQTLNDFNQSILYIEFLQGNK